MAEDRLRQFANRNCCVGFRASREHYLKFLVVVQCQNVRKNAIASVDFASCHFLRSSINNDVFVLLLWLSQYKSSPSSFHEAVTVPGGRHTLDQADQLCRAFS